MIRLNGVEYEYHPGITLEELVDDYSATHRKICFEGFVVVVDGRALTVEQAREQTLSGGENVYIVPVLDGG